MAIPRRSVAVSGRASEDGQRFSASTHLSRQACVHFRRPERIERMLKALGPMADIGGLLGRAWDRPAPADSGSVPSRPCDRRKCAVTAKQVLYVVLRRRERDINS